MVVEVPLMTVVFRVLVAAGSLDGICRDASTVNGGTTSCSSNMEE